MQINTTVLVISVCCNRAPRADAGQLGAAPHSAAPAAAAQWQAFQTEAPRMAQEPDAAAAPDMMSSAPDLAYASPQLQRYLEEQQQFAAQARHL